MKTYEPYIEEGHWTGDYAAMDEDPDGTFYEKTEADKVIADLRKRLTIHEGEVTDEDL